MMSLFPPKESLVSDIPAGDGDIEKLFLRCRGGNMHAERRGGGGGGGGGV